MSGNLKRSGVGPLTLAVALVFSACESNPPLGLGDDGDLTVEFALATVDGDPGPIGHAHVHTLEEVTFHVQVRDHHGRHVTAFDTIRVEHRRMGTDTWRTAAELHLHGEVFTGSTEYTTSGEYELRVSGMRHGHGHMDALHHEHESLGVARAHRTAGHYRIEFETFPGHVRAGSDATARFWVMESAVDAEAHRPVVTGLVATVRCEEADGSVETHVAVEPEAGVYEASHAYSAVGRARVSLEFTAPDGREVQATFEPPVTPAH